MFQPLNPQPRAVVLPEKLKFPCPTAAVLPEARQCQVPAPSLLMEHSELSAAAHVYPKKKRMADLACTDHLKAGLSKGN